MSRQTLTWTALPAGAVEGLVRVKVLVSLRLEADQGVLAEFDDLVDWPGTNPSFEVLVDGHPFAVAPTGEWPGPSSHVWQALLPRDTPVEAPPRPMDLPPIISYPVGQAAAAVLAPYAALATNGGLTEPLASSTALLREPSLAQFGLGLEIDDRDVVRGEVLGLDSLAAIGKAISLGDSAALGNTGPLTDGGKAVMQLLAFMSPRTSAEGDLEGHPRPLPPPELPVFDVHRRLAVVAGYPSLLARLGLLFDVVLPDVAVRDLPEVGWLSVAPRWDRRSRQADTEVVAPRTAFRGGQRFSAQSANGRPHPGLLDLADGYRVVTVDVDGAAVKLVNLYADLVRREVRPSVDTPRQVTLPALRAAGLALVRDGRAGHFEERLGRVQELDAAGREPELFADDLVAGLRVDVRDEDERDPSWVSLCRRSGNVVVEGVEEWEYFDEAVVSSSATAGDGPDAGPEIYLHEAIARWDGWSLATTPPTEAVPSDPERLGDPGVTFGLGVSAWTPEGSLPRLRFGHRYRLRARTVDLAGHSVEVDDADVDESLATEPVRYVRFEPVGPPVLALRSPVTPGESLHRIVVREGQPSERHVLPPQVSQLMTEQHGVFDGLSESALRNVFETLRQFEDRLPKPEAGEGKDGLLRQQICPEPIMELPHLPDPLAAGARLRTASPRGAAAAGLFGETLEPFQRRDLEGMRFWPFRRWPDAGTFRLAVVPGTEAETSASTRIIEDEAGAAVLEIRLPPAAVCPLRLNSFLFDESALAQLGVWDWISSSVSGTDLAQLSEGAVAGRYWALTPWADITLVHAVPRPLMAPELLLASADRADGDLGSTAVTVAGALEADGKSTQEVHLEATWDEWRDVGTTPDVSRPTTAPVATIPVKLHKVYGKTLTRVGLTTDSVVQPGDVRAPALEFGDTRHRVVRYTPLAVTRFAEYFPPPGEGGPDTSARPGTAKEQRVRSSARPAAPVVDSIVPYFEWEETTGEATRSRRRRGGGLRVYLNRPWWSSGEGEQLAVVFTTGPVGAAFDPYVTQWGADPVNFTQRTPAPSGARFPRARAVRDLVLPEVGTSVSIAAHDVYWNPSRQLWTCDVEIRLGDDGLVGKEPYFPFVRLAMARYQQHSLPTVALSPAVVADFCQLVPRRTMTVRRADGRSDGLQVWEVAVGGQPAGVDSVVEARVERVEEPPPDEVELDELSWAVVPSSTVTLDPTRAGWHGTVVVDPRDARPCRIVVREFELWTSDAEEAADWPRPGHRLVYADAIEIRGRRRRRRRREEDASDWPGGRRPRPNGA